MRHFYLAFAVTAACLLAAYWWKGTEAALLALVLGVMEVSLSFDNAVVNASVLNRMDEKWQMRFLTWGILIAVFGMRLLFPLLIVGVATGQGVLEVGTLALQKPDQYAMHLAGAHAQISAFGGMFLLLVFLGFVLDEGKEVHWIRIVEKALSRLGRLDSVEIACALAVLLIAQWMLPPEIRLTVIVSGVAGVLLYVVIGSLDAFFESGDESPAPGSIKKGAVLSFLYLEVLDASFSFDGVIGAFAITQDVVLIMLGLGIGAIFVRSLTVFLVRNGTLDNYIYLEHGAHYAIGALAFLMLAGIGHHIPELVTGLIGVGLILLALLSSIAHNRWGRIAADLE